MVTRYDLTEDMDGNTDITPVPESHNGRFVAAEDYDALAAENAALKSKASELVREAATVYSHYNENIGEDGGDWIDGQTLHEMQQLIEGE